MSEWKQGTVSGNSEKMGELAKAITKIAKANIHKKIVDLQAHVKAEATRYSSKELLSIHDRISELEKQYSR